MKIELLHSRTVGDTMILYCIDRETGMVGLELQPVGTSTERSDTRISPLVSVKFSDDKVHRS